MINWSKKIALCLMLAASLTSLPTADAARWSRHDRESRLAGDIGPDQAAAIVRDSTGGRVLGVRAVERNGRIIYRVKVLKNGRVRIYHVDGDSGNILG